MTMLGFLLHRMIVAAGDPANGSVLIASQPVTLRFVVWLNFGAAYLLAGLVFKFDLFRHRLCKKREGLIFAAGVYPLQQGGHGNFKPLRPFSGCPRGDHPALSLRHAICIAENGYRWMNGA
jgi:hypothetical protein